MSATVVDLSKVNLNESTLRASALVHHIDVGEEETPSSIANQLIKKFATFSDDDLAVCRCGLESPPKTDLVCPFCGAGDEPSETVSTASKNPATEEARKPMNTTTETAKPNGKAKIAASIEDVKPKASTKQTLVKTTPPRVITSPTKLDEAVKIVQRMKGAAAVGYWQLGLFIRTEIFDKELWKLRTDETGKVAYTGFNTFSLAELGMTSANAYKLMDVSKEFTEEQVLAFGPTKMTLMLGAPEAEREKILTGAEKKSTKEIKSEVKKAKAKHNVTGKRETGRKKTPSGGGRKASAAGPKTITVATMIERRRVELFTKATIKDDEPKRAKKLADIPTGWFEFSNGVKVHITIQQTPAGELVAIVEGKEPKE